MKFAVNSSRRANLEHSTDILGWRGFMRIQKAVEKVDFDACEVCGAVEGEEHAFRAHGSSKKSADELKAWKQKLEETGAHH
jgi:hypothetical protein